MAKIDPKHLTKAEIYILGAFDRFNYGDILFPLIAQKMIRESHPDLACRFVALRGNDLRSRGGVISSPISSLYKLPPNKDVRRFFMLSGGDLLSPDWSLMGSHLYPRSISYLISKLEGLAGREWANATWRRYLGAKNRVPWTLDPDDLPDAGQNTILYNSVGGVSLNGVSDEEKEWQAQALSKAAWLSVRDQPTAEAVVARGVTKPKVTPDCGVMMDELLSNQDLHVLRRSALESVGLLGTPYLVVQMASKHFWGSLSAMPDALKTIHRRTGLKVLGLPLGTATGHDDQLAVSALREGLDGAPWFHEAKSDLSVFETMALLSGASLYLGTSLHGFITAHVFGVPRVGLRGAYDISKLTGFRDAFDNPSIQTGVSVEDCPDAADLAMQVDFSSQIKVSKSAYRSSFTQMLAAAKIT